MTAQTRNWIYTAIGIAVLAAALVLLHGCASRPPSATEQRIFDIHTNIVPVVEFRTNVIVLTNVTGVTEFRTNVAFVTNQHEAYVYSPGAGAAEIRQVGTEVGNLFGVGGLVGTGLGGLLSLWGYLRSKKSYVTAANLSQVVETMREFIKQLPDGQTYDNELVNWMQNNQANAGVLTNVLQLLSREVSNPDAKEAAHNIQTIIDGLRQSVAAAKK